MKKKRWRNRKGAGLLALALACALALSGTGALETRAAIAVDTDRLCNLDVSIKALEEMAGATFDEEKVAISLYRVAEINASGDYKTTVGFDGIQEDLNRISSDPKANDWEGIAQDASSAVKDNGLTFDKKGNASNGLVSFEGLNTGLYLVVTDPVVTDNYIYTFTPYLVSLPNNYYASSGNLDDKWYYDLTQENRLAMGLKPEEHARYGDLQIEKRLDSMSAMPGDEATFVFQIDITTPKNETEQRIEAFTFDKTGSNFATIREIPAGSIVTVTEIYSGAGYKLASGPLPEQVTIVANDEYSSSTEVVSVAFENEPSSTTTGGYGIRNNFYLDGKGQYQHRPQGAEYDNVTE